MGSHSVTCHPAEVTFTPLPQPKLVLDLATPERCKAELTRVNYGGGSVLSVDKKRQCTMRRWFAACGDYFRFRGGASATTRNVVVCRCGRPSSVAVARPAGRPPSHRRRLGSPAPVSRDARINDDRTGRLRAIPAHGTVCALKCDVISGRSSAPEILPCHCSTRRHAVLQRGVEKPGNSLLITEKALYMVSL